MDHSNSERLIYLDYAGAIVTGITAMAWAFLAAVEATLRPKWPMKLGVRGACAGFIYSSGVVGMTYLRQKEDNWNHAIPLAIAAFVGSIAFWPRPRFSVAISYGVLSGWATFAALSLLDQYFLDNSATPPEYKAVAVSTPHHQTSSKMAHSKRLILVEYAGVFVIGMAALTSATTATIEAILRTRKPMIGGVRGARMGFIFSCCVVGLTYLRQKEDKWNTAIALTVATTVDNLAFFPRLRFPVAVSIGVLCGWGIFVSLSLFDKYYFNDNKDLATALAPFEVMGSLYLLLVF